MAMPKHTSDDPICQRVDNLLSELGISRRELARSVNIIHTTLNIQLREGELKARIIAPIADRLGVSVHYLLTGRDDWMALSAQSFTEARRLLEETAAQLHRCQGLYLEEAI